VKDRKLRILTLLIVGKCYVFFKQGHRRALKLLEEEYNEKIARLEAQVM